MEKSQSSLISIPTFHSRDLPYVGDGHHLRLSHHDRVRAELLLPRAHSHPRAYMGPKVRSRRGRSECEEASPLSLSFFIPGGEGGGRLRLSLSSVPN